MITQAQLKRLVSYDQNTGWLTYLASTCSRVRAGATAGSNTHGYIRIFISGRSCPAHRLAYLFMTGEWPAADIDHINGNRSDNRWANLRSASRSENLCNTTRHRNNKSGHKGVHWSKRANKWTSQIRFRNKVTHLGYFDTPESAGAAYVHAARQVHGNFSPMDL